MVVANIENGQFSDELGALMLTNETLQNRLLDNIVATARRYGFRDIHFDFEYLRPEDREAYNAFLRKAKRRFEREGWMMSTALAPKTSATQRGRWYEAHDYRAHGQIVDFVVIMTYEWGYSGGPPMPVSPIGPVRRVLEYAISEMPAGKILMGQNLYGYDWTLPYVPGGPYAQAISPQQAIALAAKYNVAIEYDTEAQAPHFRYRDENGREHEVWFEDARSIQAKFNLVKELGLRGGSYWKLGIDFPQNWLLIADQFTVVKNKGIKNPPVNGGFFMMGNGFRRSAVSDDNLLLCASVLFIIVLAKNKISCSSLPTSFTITRQSGKVNQRFASSTVFSANDVPIPHVRTKRFRNDDRAVFLLVVFQNGGDRPPNG